LLAGWSIEGNEKGSEAVVVKDILRLKETFPQWHSSHAGPSASAYFALEDPAAFTMQ
jgi:hypothetical protein